MKESKKIKRLLIVFMFLLILSGITAFPIQSEINFLAEHKDFFPSLLSKWILSIKHEIDQTPNIVFYGTDWLAFAHIIISLFFIPVIQKPVQYQINLKIGMLACFFVFPLAFICGPIRGIPFFHQLIDCSFGVFGFLLLFYIHLQINKIKKYENRN